VLKKQSVWVTGFETSNPGGWADCAGEHSGVAVFWLELHHLAALTTALDNSFPQHYRHSQVGLIICRLLRSGTSILRLTWLSAWSFSVRHDCSLLLNNTGT